jgi:hypothetical protein
MIILRSPFVDHPAVDKLILKEFKYSPQKGIVPITNPR